MSEIVSVPNSSPVDVSLAPAQPVIMTENAAKKVSELIEEEENLQLKLRVFITGGGCSGFQYGFTFDEVINEEDTVVTTRIKKNNPHSTDQAVQTVQLLIDPMSLVYLVGAEIDYKSDLSGEQFIIRNPNAKTTCGCGSSFAA
ncbi:MAG: iron-sulfur cluster insertion protein ErpA [Candidatus Aquirickettsiella gammari]|uniref:Iron-sulfur cluster insertion protein ErpA n=1 Tax=Candidatus Aquirickettsiella gammari TaxID=2016198 RepID=A0A370CKW9_9COXI|nr:MAG: iron-sulfur cluster insertion protein ErpA [Candidatus Aquirickettsiella gammari]